MSHVYGGVSYKHRSDMIEAVVYSYLSAGGVEPDQSVAKYLSNYRDAEIIRRVQGSEWLARDGEGVTDEEIKEALTSLRTEFPKSP